MEAHTLLVDVDDCVYFVCSLMLTSLSIPHGYTHLSIVYVLYNVRMYVWVI